MTKKYKITKRFLAFALSVAMIVTFTPTSFLAYAENPTKEAAVEEPAAEPTAPTEDVVKEEPTGEDAVQEEDQTKDEVVEEKAEKDAKEDVKEDDIPVYAGIRILQEPQHKTYNAEEQSIEYSASELESLYEVVYQVGDEQVESLPEGFDVEVLFTDIQNGLQLNTTKGIVIKGTDAGRYGAVVRARISGSAPGYRIPQAKVIDSSIEMIIDPAEVNVTVKGITDEITYDGQGHSLGECEFIADNDLYDVKKDLVNNSGKPEYAINVGEYETAFTGAPCQNKNDNFNVHFTYEPGKLTINKAPLKVVTETDRHIAVPGSTEMFTSPSGWVVGLVGRDLKPTVMVSVDGELALDQTETVTVDNTVESIAWGGVNTDNYEITYELGTLTVFAQDEVQVEIRGNTNDKKYIYDGATHSVEGWHIADIDNPLFEEIYKQSSEKVIVFNGNSRVEEVNAGFYPMGLTADMFSIDKSFEGAQDFKVTFIVKDGGLTIDKRALTVTISPNNERYPYTGQEYSMRAFNWSYYGALEEVGYTEDYIDYDGDNVIKGTEIGIYSETLRLEKFHNNNDNYNVTFRLSNSPFGPRPHKEDSKTATAAKDAKEDVTEYTSSLEIFRPVVIVRIHGNKVDVPYDGTEHTLKIDADSNKAFLDGAEQEGSGFTVESVSNKYEVPFDESKIILRSDITLSGTDVGVYRERGWASRLSYDDPNVAVEFETTPMILRVTPKKLTLVVDDQEVTYEGKDVFEYENELTAHYEGLPEGEEGPEFRLFFGGFVKDELPEGAAEQHFLDAEILSDPGQYDIEVKRGIFTLKKRPVTVTVTGDKVRVPYNGERQSLDVNVDELDMSCDDELYDLGFVEAKELDKLQAKGKDPDQYPIGLEEKLELINHDEHFDVNFVINDGYLEIVGDSAPIDIGEINVEGGIFEYDGEVHPAQLANDEVTVGDKTYKIKKPKFQYHVISCESEIPDFMEEPVYAGEYSADIDKFRVFDGDVDVTAFCDFERGDSATITITPRPINIKITGAKVKKVYTGDSVLWSSSAEIEILNPISNEPEDTGYWEVLNQRFLTFDGGTAWPKVEGDTPGERYNMGLDKALDHNLFVNNNPNYEVVEFIIEDGYMDLVGEDEMFDLPNPTSINEEFTYDGKAHFIHRNFKELQDDGSFEITGSDGNTYTVKPKFRTINFLEGGYVRAGIYRWYRTVSSVKVFDEDGFDVTNLVNDPWEGRQFSGTLTIKPIAANVTVKGDVSKTYGDPDPDESTWVTVDAKDKASESIVKRALTVKRARGENVGKYEIKLFLPEIAIDEPDPGAVAVKDDSQEAAKKDAKRASEEVKEVVPSETRAGVIGYEGEKKTIQEEKWTSLDLTVDDEDKFFTINKAPLTISANDDEKDFGTEDPTLTATVSKGLVGSESLPKNFYSVYRDKGEDVRMLPDDWYVIHVDAPNVDVDWDAETHCFKEEGLLPPPEEEAYAQAEAAQEAVAKEADAWEYAAKSMKAARALSAVKAEKQIVDFPETFAEIAEYKEDTKEEWKEYDDVVKPDEEKYDITSFTEFNPMNYDIRTANGKFNINGDSPSVDDPDDPDDPVVTADTDDSNNSGNKGSSSSTGDEFGLMGMMMLLTASLIGLLALVSRRRREQE